MVRNENECDQCLLGRKFSKLTSSLWCFLPSSTEAPSFVIIVVFSVSSVAHSLAHASLCVEVASLCLLAPGGGVVYRVVPSV